MLLRPVPWTTLNNWQQRFSRSRKWSTRCRSSRSATAMPTAASFCSLTQGMNNPVAIEAQHRFQRAAASGAEVMALSTALLEAIQDAIAVF